MTHVQKLSLSSAYISVHKFNTTFLSKTYFNSETSLDDNNLEIPGYNIIRNDHTSNTKHGGVCICYKNTF